MRPGPGILPSRTYSVRALVSLSRFRTADVAFALMSWADGQGIPVVRMKDLQAVWYQAASFRERWHNVNWYGLEVDVRWLANESVPVQEKGRAVYRMLQHGPARFGALAEAAP